MTKRDIYSLIALRLVENAEAMVLVDAESKKSRNVTLKNQERARERMLEEIEHTPEELKEIKEARKKRRELMERNKKIAAQMNKDAKTRTTYNNKPKIRTKSLNKE